MAIQYVDLLTDSGELIRIECPDKHYDQLSESLEHAMKRKDWWSPNMFDGCKAEYMGISLSRVAMGKIIGIL